MAMLTKSHNRVEPCIPGALRSEDFMSVFSGEIIYWIPSQFDDSEMSCLLLVHQYWIRLTYL